MSTKEKCAPNIVCGTGDPPLSSFLSSPHPIFLEEGLSDYADLGENICFSWFVLGLIRDRIANVNISKHHKSPVVFHSKEANCSSRNCSQLCEQN